VIERHIEKIVLGVFVLLLVFAAVHWGLGSPLEIEVITNSRGTLGSFPPGQVDANLLSVAKDIQAVIDRAQPERYEAVDYSSGIVRLQKRPFDSPMSLISVGQPSLALSEAQLSGSGVALPTMQDILSVLPEPTKPLVRVERELPRMEGIEPADVIAAHVAGTYPWAELKKRWNDKLAATTIPADPVAVAVEAEVRERRFDGTWGPAVPVSSTHKPAYGPEGTESVPPAPVDFDGNNADAVLNTVYELAQNWQENVLQPAYWDILWSIDEWGTWRKHLPATSVSEEMPIEEQGPGKQPKFDLKGAGGLDFGQPTLRRTRTPQASRQPARPSMGSKMDMGSMMKMGGMEMMGVNDRASRRARRAARTPTATRVRRPAPARRTQQAVSPVGAVKEVAAIKVTAVPPLADQIEKGQVLFWLHDTALKSSKVYQYRVRLVLVNPLVASPGDAKNPEDAEPAIVKTPFSEWSNPVSVPQDTEFFVTSHSQTRGYARVTVFKRSLGQWVKSNFSVSEGETIGGRSKVKLVNPEDGSQVRREEDFDTGAVVVRLDFEKTILRKGKIVTPTVEMYYLDEEGMLKTRIGQTDKDSERYDQLKEEANRTKAAASRMVAAESG